MKKSVYLSVLCGSLATLLLSCSGSPAPKAEVASEPQKNETVQSSVSVSEIPESYKDIRFPEFNYVTPNPVDYRVQIAEGVTGYIVSSRSLPLVNFTVYFEEGQLPSVIQDEAASSMVGSMFRRGAGGGLTPHALDDSLEFISAGLSTSAGTFSSSFEIDCLSKDFRNMLDLAQKVLLDPAFDKDQLEIIKANYITAYERRYDTPAKILSALETKVNYAPNPRLWDPNLEEYKKVSADDVRRLAKGTFSSKKIVFALSGDIDKDSATTLLKDFFAKWKVKEEKTVVAPTPYRFLNKPGTYVVDKDISQANIRMSQPFVKRPHPDYYPAAVASFILGGGSFSSRLMNRVRSDEGLAYSVYSSVDNDYRDTGMTTISIQTKVETVDYALKLIFEEVEKLAKDGPTEEELSLAKKTLIESLPSLFDSPESTASIFAVGDLLGKKDNHYLEYIREVNAVTPEQVKQMTAKYFSKEKMTISVVGPVAKLEALKPFIQLSVDSLDFRD